VRGVLDQAFGELWVTGEISNLKRHASGHVYFSLKDGNAQIKAAIWKSSAVRLRFEPRDGLEVLARGRVGLYPQTGQYQFYVNALLPKGLGELELAFRQLQQKLAQLGWFDSERKKPLPRFPKHVTLVTSSTGAVARDMVRIIARRWPPAEVLVCPVPVQGDGAAQRIARAIAWLNQWGKTDVMIVGRGGGSLEDLWAFNEEVLAAAILESRIPVISAVGHEVDFTIADFVADHRAATPSEAAELVVPDLTEWLNHLEARRQFFAMRLAKTLASARQSLTELASRSVLRDPLRRVRDLSMQLDGWDERLQSATKRRLDRARDALASQTARLEGLSPLNVLGRGYSLCRKEGEATLLRTTDSVRLGERLTTQLAKGQLVSRVEAIEPEQPADGRTRRDQPNL
jgi:exodeoxyribonuclease VII large subunit